MNFTFISITAGFLVNTNTMPVYSIQNKSKLFRLYLSIRYVQWVRYLSFLSYGYRIAMSNEFSNRNFPCPYTNPENCYLYNGNDILSDRGAI